MADIILRSAKGSNLTPGEVDSNFKNLNDSLMALQLSGSTGTVTSVAVNNLLGGVFNIDITGVSTINPTIRFRVTGSSGYVKSNGTALSTSATIPFSDITGTVPVAQGGTGLTAVGSANTFLSSNGSALVYRTVTSPDSSINLSFGSSSLDISVNQSVLDISTMNGVLPVTMGGTGFSASSRQGLINYLTNVSSATLGQVLQRDSGGNVSWVTPSAGAGTVTSVSLTTTGISAVLNATLTNPTTTPAISIAVTGSAGYVKSSGSALSVSATVAASDLSGAVAIANGGTGQTTRQAAINSLTDVAGASTNNVLIKNGSGDAAWGSLLAVSDLSITSQRSVAINTIIQPTDYLIRVDTHQTGSLYLPEVSTLSAGKTIVVKDISGYAASYNWNIYPFSPPNTAVTLENSYSTPISLNTNNQCIEFMLVVEVIGMTTTKKWIVKSMYKPT